MVAYNTKTSGYNDIAYICVGCKRDLDNGTLPHCNDCGRAMRNRVNCFCNLRKNEPIKTPTITEIMAQSYVAADMLLTTNTFLKHVCSADWEHRHSCFIH